MLLLLLLLLFALILPFLSGLDMAGEGNGLALMTAARTASVGKYTGSIFSYDSVSIAVYVQMTIRSTFSWCASSQDRNVLHAAFAADSEG